MSTTTQIIDLDQLRIAGREFRRGPAPVDLPETTGWMHSGCAITSDGTVVVAHPEGRKLIFTGRDGTQRIVDVPVLEMHTILLDTTDERDTLWLVNNGHRFVRNSPDYAHYRERGSVIRVDLDGHVLQELDCPATLDYANEHWQPTSLTRASDGTLWVADGYGLSLAHQYSTDGRYLRTINGSETGLTFDCPHGIAVRGEQILIADRSNRRVLVTENGLVVKTLNAPLTSPSSFLVLGDWLLVTELHGGLAVFHADDYIGHFARSRTSAEVDAWPNERDQHGDMTAPALREELRSPHGIASDGRRIIVTQWHIGGNVTAYSAAT